MRLLLPALPRLTVRLAIWRSLESGEPVGVLPLLLMLLLLLLLTRRAKSGDERPPLPGEGGG